jgi:hypothetical protein
MNEVDQLNVFHAALVAFEVRFEGHLITVWERHQWKIRSEIESSPVTDRYKIFKQFFEEAGGELSAVIHEYFPSLLQIATANRRHLEEKSPLDWTQDQIVAQVRNFLGFDETFDMTSDPRDDNRVLSSAASITTGREWLEPSDLSTFVLPLWTQTPHPMRMVFCFNSSEERSKYESRIENESLSRAETIKWLKFRELLLLKEIERQIDNDSLDGIIEAGKNGICVTNSFSVEVQPLPNDQDTSDLESRARENQFIREASTWMIAFDGESCRLKTMIGLDYIAILLASATREFRPLELQRLVSGSCVAKHQVAHCVEESLAEEELQDDPDEVHDRSIKRSDFTRDDLVDGSTMMDLSRKLEKLEEEIGYRTEIGDTKAADDLSRQYSQIERYLKTSRDVHGRSRVFANENEKARQSITGALKRAYNAIQEQAPKTASHLSLQIKTGLIISYLDSATQWRVQRIPNSIRAR